MERRLYFLFGDLVSNVVMGALAGFVVAHIVGEAWSMIIGMGVGMIVGMGVSFLALLIFCPIFGALEVLLPTMLTGMLAGMVVGMTATMQTVGGPRAAGMGGFIGLGVMIGVTFFNAKLQGEDRRWIS